MPSTGSEVGNAIGHSDAGHTGTVSERIIPILVTLVRITTLVMLIQPLNASSPMLMTLLGTVTLVRLAQP